MNTYRVRLTLRSPLGTPLVADTLFGHLCWGVAYHEGAEAVTAFLGKMQGAEPPLIISDPLPAEHWPTPVLPPPPREQADSLKADIQKRLGDPLASHDLLRGLTRRPWLPHTIWPEVAAGLSSAGIAGTLFRRDVPGYTGLKPEPVAHNTINRLSGQTLEEGGFFFDSLEFAAGPAPYDVWVRTAFDAERLRRVFERGLAGGYGRDSSTGKGHLTVDAVEPLALPTVADANAVMTLGVCAPAAGDPIDGYWNIDVRHGKLGGPYALHAGGDDQTPVFKKPVVLLARGAVFRSERPRPFMGRIVRDVHPTRSEVITCGLTLTLPVRLVKEAMPCPRTA